MPVDDIAELVIDVATEVVDPADAVDATQGLHRRTRRFWKSPLFFWSFLILASATAFWLVFTA